MIVIGTLVATALIGLFTLIYGISQRKNSLNGQLNEPEEDEEDTIEFDIYCESCESRAELTPCFFCCCLFCAGCHQKVGPNSICIRCARYKVANPLKA